MHVPERGAWDLAGLAVVKEVSILQPCSDGSRQGPEEGLGQAIVVKPPSGDAEYYDRPNHRMVSRLRLWSICEPSILWGLMVGFDDLES